MIGHLADTSIFVAAEQGRGLRPPPQGPTHVSVVTLTELIVGVRRAPDERTRQARSATLDQARRFIARPYDEPVAEHLADLVARAAAQQRRIGVMDAIIAATALAGDLTVWTQDDDFAVIAELEPRLRVHRG